MKKSIFISFVFLFFLLPFTYTQEIDIPKALYCVKDLDAEPGDDSQVKLKLNGTCFNTTDKDTAKKKLMKLIKPKYVCKATKCDFPNESGCSMEITVPEPVLVDNQMCFKGEVVITCGHCVASVDGVKNEQPVQDDDNNATGVIENIYPNPSTGIVNLDLDVKERGLNTIEVQVIDISGKQLLQKDYQKISASHFHASLDLSQFSNGLYFINVLINGKSAGTGKVSIG